MVDSVQTLNALVTESKYKAPSIKASPSLSTVGAVDFGPKYRSSNESRDNAAAVALLAALVSLSAASSSLDWDATSLANASAALAVAITALSVAITALAVAIVSWEVIPDSAHDLVTAS